MNVTRSFDQSRILGGRWDRCAVASVVMLASILMAQTTVLAEVGPLPEDDTGVIEDTGADVAGDAGDVAPMDVEAPMDAETTDTAPDVVDRDASSSTDADAGGDTGTTPPSGPAKLDGRVTVKFADDNADVTVTVEPEFGSWSVEQTTGASGDFAFDDIPTGRYQLTFQRTDYVQQGRTLELRGDRSLRVDLFPDQSVQLRAEALFEETDAPESVTFRLNSDRGSLSPSEDPVPVDSNVATWTVDDLPVGNWTLTAEADDYLPAAYSVGVPPSEESSADPRQYDIRLHMVSENREADSVSDGGGGCGCRDEDARGGGGGGRIPGGFGPGAVLLVGLLALRRWATRATP